MNHPFRSIEEKTKKLWVSCEAMNKNVLYHRKPSIFVYYVRWGINLLANLYSPQLIPVFLPECFCSRMSVAQLFNYAIKNSESHGPLELERHYKVWYQTRNDITLPSDILYFFLALSCNSLSLCHILHLLIFSPVLKISAQTKSKIITRLNG